MSTFVDRCVFFLFTTVITTRCGERSVHEKTLFRVFSGVMITHEPSTGMEQ
jgi:hypothetical protein